MRGLVLSDLRHSIRIWASSVLVLAVAQLAVMWSLGLLMVGVGNLWMLDRERLTDFPPVSLPGGEAMPAEVLSLLPTGIITAMAITFTIAAAVASITTRNVINAIVYQRRRVMALWQLAGMTERQLIRILRGQVALLSVAGFIGAAIVALLTAPWLLDLVRATGLLHAPPMRVEGVYLGYLLGAGVGSLLCVLAVRGAIRELREINPLDAIRSEGVRELPMTRRRWIGVIVWSVVWVGMVAATAASETVKDATQGSLLIGVLGIAVMNIGGPVLIVGLINAWTRLIPAHASAAWFLARETLRAATARSVASVGSISIAIFLFTALFSQQGERTDAASFTLLVGFPLAIAVTGSVVLVFMAGQQREREIHLAELAGATPAQQRLQALFEAVITVVTGSGIGLFFCVVMIGSAQPAHVRETGTTAFVIAWGDFAVITGILLVLNVLATVVPTMIAHSARDRAAIVE